MRRGLSLLFVVISAVAAMARMSDHNSAEAKVEVPGGSIYGVAFTSNGQPAKRIGLTAMPLGVTLGTLLPRTVTNDQGEFRFERLPWWGKYTVFAEDEEAGYSQYSTGASGQSLAADITPSHKEAELRVDLPPKAGFLRVRLMNRSTGAPVPAMRITVMRDPDPTSLVPLEFVFSMSCYSSAVVLLPPNKELLLHITSDGFREWKESAEKGKKLRLASGERATLDVQLDPAE